MTDVRHPHHLFLLLCLAASFTLAFFIFQPFLVPLILAAVFAYLFQPLYQRLLRYVKNREGLAASATALIATVIVLLPLLVLGTLIFKEASGLYQTLAEDSGSFVEMLKDVSNQVRSLVPLPDTLQLDMNQYLRQGLAFVTTHLGTVFSGLAQLILDAFVFLAAFYFLLKDGGRLKDRLITLSPLSDQDDELIVSRLGAAVSSAVRGNLLIGLIQGALTGVGFAIFGVPNPVLWGGVAAIAALIPGIGTALVFAPAILFSFLTGNTFGGVGLLAWGVAAVGLIDNLLGPKLIGRGMQMHPLVVFLAVLGGIAFFGPFGFLLGPLALSVCFALIDIHASLKARLG